jgi:hypothetical protein
MGKLPAADSLAMLRMSNQVALTGADRKARNAWSQRHARDPRSKQRTEDEVAGQTTLLAWARSNISEALVRKTVRRGRVANWKLDFGFPRLRGFPRHFYLFLWRCASCRPRGGSSRVPAATGAWCR